MFLAILKTACVNRIFSHQFAMTLIQSILKSSLVVFPLFLNKEIPIFGSSVEYPCIFDILQEIDLNSLPMFQSFQKLPVVQFSTKVADHALVDRFGLLLSKI